MTTIKSLAAIYTQPALRKASQKAALVSQSLASGYKSDVSIANLAVGTILGTKSNALSTAVTNAGQGKSLAGTAKAALEEILELLEEQKSLATKANDSSLSTSELAALDIEFQELTTEINRIANNTEFNNKKLLDGTISNTVSATSVTGQTIENHSLLATTDYSLSGTVSSGDLATSSTFAVVQADAVGDVAGTVQLDFTAAVGGAVTNAVIQIGGSADITFGSGDATATAVADAFVAAAEASTDNTVRQFTYSNSAGVVTITGADLGDLVNSTTFALTNRGTNLTANTLTLGGDNIDTLGSGAALSITTATTKTLGADRTVSASDLTFDFDLEGSLTAFDSSLTTSGTQNTVTFTATVNNITYTSQAVTLFGTGGFNSKGNTIKNGQAITFFDNSGPTDSSGEFKESAFTLTVGASDVSVSGSTQTAFEDSLDTIAGGFTTQLTNNRVNQRRDIFLSVEDENGADFDISNAEGTILAGIHGFDRVGTNSKGDILLTSDSYATDGTHGGIGPFDFNRSTHTLTTTIAGETFSADLSGSGFSGTYDTGTNVLTTDGTITFTSAATNDGRTLTIDLSNVTNSSITINTSTLEETFETAFDDLFGVTGQESVNIQVGNNSTDTINVKVDSSTTSDIYLNDDGVAKTLSLQTVAGAAVASDVLDNAINEITDRIAEVSADITSFNSSIDVNNVAIQNLDAAVLDLIGTDFVSESTRLAELLVQIEAGSAALAQIHSNLRNISKLLEF